MNKRRVSGDLTHPAQVNPHHWVQFCVIPKKTFRTGDSIFFVREGLRILHVHRQGANEIERR